jgi:hypothetical protein
MTEEYFPAWIVAISNLLLVAMVVLCPSLPDTVQYRALRPLARFMIAVSFILATLVFLCIGLTAHGLSRYHVYDRHTVGERVLDFREEPPSGVRSLGTSWDRGTGVDRRPQLSDP